MNATNKLHYFATFGFLNQTDHIAMASASSSPSPKYLVLYVEPPNHFSNWITCYATDTMLIPLGFD